MLKVFIEKDFPSHFAARELNMRHNIIKHTCWQLSRLLTRGEQKKLNQRQR